VSRRETYHAPLRDREEAGRIVVSVRPTSKLASFAIAGTVNSVLTGQAIPADSDTTLPRGKLPTRIPAKHQLLLAALRKLGKPVTNEWSGGIWAQFGFTEKCNGCQTCAFFCPTGALTMIEQEGKLGVAFKLTLCANCRLCQELCYLDAVTLSPKIDLNKVVNDAVETFLMVDAESVLWKLSPEERLKKTLLSN
jgi:Formate hydrogenlyase subunit 6/NADH:ubiquinone oxidoreductase 23 kD subunit (chain I)